MNIKVGGLYVGKFGRELRGKLQGLTIGNLYVLSILSCMSVFFQINLMRKYGEKKL